MKCEIILKNVWKCVEMFWKCLEMFEIFFLNVGNVLEMVWKWLGNENEWDASSPSISKHSSSKLHDVFFTIENNKKKKNRLIHYKPSNIVKIHIFLFYKCS